MTIWLISSQTEINHLQFNAIVNIILVETWLKRCLILMDSFTYSPLPPAISMSTTSLLSDGDGRAWWTKEGKNFLLSWEWLTGWNGGGGETTKSIRFYLKRGGRCLSASKPAQLNHLAVVPLNTPGFSDRIRSQRQNLRAKVKEETGFIPVVVGAIFVFHIRLEQMGSSVEGGGWRILC